MSFSKIDLRRFECLLLLIVSLVCLYWYWTPQFGRAINFSILLFKHWFPGLFSFFAGLF
jgi:hypothetical protein